MSARDSAIINRRNLYKWKDRVMKSIEIKEYNNNQVPYIPTEYLSACIKENGEIEGEILI